MHSVIARSSRDAAYLAVGMATSIAAFGVWVAGVTVSLTLAVFVVGLPAILATAIVFRYTAELDRLSASLFLGRPVRGRYRDHAAATLLGRLRATMTDPQTWRDFAWLTAHSVVGFAFGTVVLTLVGSVVGLLSLPLRYWALPDGVQFGLWTADTLPLALASAVLALPLIPVTLLALRVMARTEARIAAALLGGW